MSYVLPVFADKYEMTPPEDRSRYVAAEIRRLFEAGGAVLLPILAPTVSDGARISALEMLRDNADADGEPVFDAAHQWRLKLKDGAKPPMVDPNGLKLPPEKAGKVLVAKVSVLGANVTRAREDATPASDQWRGDRRAIRAMTGAPLLGTREVSARPAVYSLREATLILQRWGVGVELKQYARPKNWRPDTYADPDDPASKGQDRWLVEELPARPAESTDNPSTKAKGTKREAEAAL